MDNKIDLKHSDPVLTYQSTIYLLAILYILFYSVYYLLAGFFRPFYVSLLIVLCFGVSYFLSRKGKYGLAVTAGLITLVINTFAFVCFFGIHFGSHYFLLAANVLLSLNVSIKKRVVLPVSLVITSAYFVSLILLDRESSLYSIPESRLYFFRELNIVMAFTLLALSVHRYTTALRQMEEELERFHGRVVRMAHTDALTNLPNRRSVEEELDVILKCRDIEESSRGIAIAMADLDNFKKVNDTYGHSTGDEVLKEIASRFERSIRNYDFLGRWGGEEFIFILRDTTPKQAYDTMERIRKQVTARPVECSNASLDVTVTFGVSHLP